MVKGESAAPAVGLPTQLGTGIPFADHALKIDLDTALLDLNIAFPRLVQSQPQTGTASAVSTDKNTEAQSVGLTFHPARDLLNGGHCHRNHSYLTIRLRLCTDTL